MSNRRWSRSKKGAALGVVLAGSFIISWAVAWGTSIYFTSSFVDVFLRVMLLFVTITGAMFTIGIYKETTNKSSSEPSSQKIQVNGLDNIDVERRGSRGGTQSRPSIDWDTNIEYADTELQARLEGMSSSDFEHLIMDLWESQNWEVKSPDSQMDSGIDFLATRAGGLMEQTAMVVVKQYPNDNLVPASEVHRVSGLLQSTIEVDIAMIVTTAGFTNSARDFADTTVKLLDGQNLSNFIQENEIGYLVDKYAPKLSDQPATEGTIPSLEIPMASNFDTLKEVIMAVNRGKDTKVAIAEYLEGKTDKRFVNRQADYYTTSGWILGFLYEDTVIRNNESIRRWGVTSIGKDYVEDSLSPDAANQILIGQIRQVEIISRILIELEQEGCISKTDLVKIVERESDLTGATAERRGSTIQKWLMWLPEVTGVSNNGDSYFEYCD